MLMGDNLLNYKYIPVVRARTGDQPEHYPAGPGQIPACFSLRLGRLGYTALSSLKPRITTMLSNRRFRFASTTAFIALAGISMAWAAGVDFKPVKTGAELDQAVAEAAKAGKRVMLDFTADWCAPCKKMEKSTFPDPEVKAALDGYVLLQVDVTRNSAEDQALLKRFETPGPPVIAFYDAKGNELKQCRVKGYMKADKFRDHINSCTRG
jgi:thioredoxin-related protein